MQGEIISFFAAGQKKISSGWCAIFFGLIIRSWKIQNFIDFIANCTYEGKYSGRIHPRLSKIQEEISPFHTKVFQNEAFFAYFFSIWDLSMYQIAKNIYFLKIWNKVQSAGDFTENTAKIQEEFEYLGQNIYPWYCTKFVNTTQFLDFDMKFSKNVFFLKVTSRAIFIKIVIFKVKKGCQLFLEKKGFQNLCRVKWGVWKKWPSGEKHSRRVYPVYNVHLYSSLVISIMEFYLFLGVVSRSKKRLKLWMVTSFRWAHRLPNENPCRRESSRI